MSAKINVTINYDKTLNLFYHFVSITNTVEQLEVIVELAEKLFPKDYPLANLKHYVDWRIVQIGRERAAAASMSPYLDKEEQPYYNEGSSI